MVERLGYYSKGVIVERLIFGIFCRGALQFVGADKLHAMIRRPRLVPG
jgi:hypothetical protein